MNLLPPVAKQVSSALLIICLSFFTTLAQNKYPIKMPVHPRVLVTAKDIPALKERIQHPDFASLMRAFKEQKEYATDGVSANGEPDEHIRQKIESLAFDYLLDHSVAKEAGLAAVQLIQVYLPSITKTKGYHQNAHTYDAVFTASLVYDWCYDLLDTATKTKLIAQMKSTSCLAEYCIFKNTPKQYLNGHYGEYAPSVFLAMGLAIYDEQQEVFDFAYQEQVERFAPTRNPWYASGAHHQGSQYIHVRYGNELLQAFLLEKLGISPYKKEISTVAFRELFANIPQSTDMDGMPEGDCHNNITMGNHYMAFVPIAATLSKNPFLQGYAQMSLDKLSEIPTRAFLFYNPLLSAAPFDSLPLSRFFSSPSGLMIARTKWDINKKGKPSDALVVLMNMREYNAKNHVHLDVGHFGIYYKGHLALDAGIYQGKDPNNEWGKLNYVNYYARTVAHNSLLILDPNEPTPYEGSNIKAISRDGGQFSFKNRAFDSIQEMFVGGKSAEILAHEIKKGMSPDYTYLMGDMTRAYNVPKNVAVYPAKADTVKRSFVFLNLHNPQVPGALIVLDKVVSTDASFQKKWLLHSQNEPTVSNGIIRFESTEAGRNGKLVNEVLLPELNNQQIEKIGGQGKEYWVDGKNWGTVTQPDAGRWRIELSPKTAAKSDNFLNVIQVMDASPSPKALATTKALSTQGNYVAITIDNRIVAQHLRLCTNASPITFTIGDKKKVYHALVTDLKTGKWNVNGKQIVTVAKDAGTAYFDTKGGMVKLEWVGE